MLVGNSGRLQLHFFLMFTTRGYRKIGSDRNKNNVGIKKRLAIFSKENPDLEKLQIDEHALDQIESEFTSGSEMSDFHRRNVEKIKKKIDFKVIQRKYFEKVKLPNFLTWAEKEQIKEMYKSEPTFWTYSKLSQNFPATPDIIKKIVESNWKAEDMKRILKHDKQVNKNWEMLRKGELKLDPILEQHLKGFSSRELIQHTEDYDFVSVKIPSPAKGSEFTKIITDYQDRRMKLTEKPNDPKRISDQSGAIETRNNQLWREQQSFSSYSKPNEKNYRVENTQDRTMMTLDELRNKIHRNAEWISVSELDKAVLKGAEQGEVSTVVNVDDIETMPVNKKRPVNQKDFILQTKEDSKMSSDLDNKIHMKITIPKDAEKGSVYRVKDTYYDTDGRFLYRVPGMRGAVD